MATEYISLLILSIVFFLIAVRKIGNIRIKIWHAMTLGAAAVILLGQISPLDAIYSVNIDVIVFLFGMFVVGESMYRSGYLNMLAQRIFHRATDTNQLILLILFPIGLLSALLMNDTLAIIGTPLVLGLSKKHGISPKLLLLTLAFAVTTGSVMSPIGNPQNLLIASSGSIASPFITFIQYLALPTILCLFVTFIMLRIFFRSEFHISLVENQNEGTQTDNQLVQISKLALMLTILLIAVKVILVVVAPSIEMKLSHIAIAASLPILLLSRQRVEIVKNIDWSTLLFFVSMFVLMASVWQSGVFQELISAMNLDLTSVPTIITVGILLSQFISNVPLVALFVPIFSSNGASIVQLMTLAAGSTIAGNMLVLGAASNVIIIQNAEKQGETIEFLEFAKIGIPLTSVQTIVYLTFLLLVS
ncbi:MAG: anion transporter [Candidatus Thorarchaeota archaeon SMTZ-45]|nr:MAG: anion transporter [Candidatus Thorarchaeota archaeon SMTZ-45]